MLKGQADPFLENRLADAQRAFGYFAHNVAHDLGAPLRNVVNFSQLLEQRYGMTLDERARHYVELITDSSRKAQARLAGLLQYADLETPSNLTPVDCNRVLYDCLEQLKPEIEQKQAQIKRETMPTLTADAGRLGLLFYFLLSNALTYCKQLPVIRVNATQGPDVWIFSICDNGIGIARKDQEAIFNVFHRLHKEEAYPGTGMGLALARRIVEQHGGMLWLESEPDEGSIFYFSLPER